MKKLLLCGLPLLCNVAFAEASGGYALYVPDAYLLILLILALIVAFVVVGNMKAKLKTAKKQAAAANYVREGSLDMRVSQDWFLYKTVDRRKIESSK